MWFSFVGGKNCEEDKNVGWEVENVGGSFGGRTFLLEEKVMGGTDRGRKNLPPTKFSSH